MATGVRQGAAEARTGNSDAVAAVRVAVADDVSDMRLLVRILLEQDGRYEVVGEAADGQEAIALVARTQPDLLLLDRQMPVLGGIEALPGIRQASPGTHVVLYTAAIDEGARHAALAAGALDVLRKDVLAAEFTDRLADTLLAHWEGSRQVELRVGPVRSEAVLSWVANTRGIVDLVRRHPELPPVEVPPEVLARFDRFLDTWEEVAGADATFTWRASAPRDEAVELLEAWAAVDRIPEDVLAAHGCHWSDPLGREYFDALTTAVVEALERDDATSRLAAALRRQGW